MKKGVISTPNLAWWVNRLVLMLGFQLYFSEPSIKINVGKAFRKVAPYNASDQYKAFTLRALTFMLKYYGFGVMATQGAPGQHAS